MFEMVRTPRLIIEDFMRFVHLPLLIDCSCDTYSLYPPMWMFLFLLTVLIQGPPLACQSTLVVDVIMLDGTFLMLYIVRVSRDAPPGQ